jgi:hypothetical protein
VPAVLRCKKRNLFAKSGVDDRPSGSALPIPQAAPHRAREQVSQRRGIAAVEKVADLKCTVLFCLFSRHSSSPATIVAGLRRIDYIQIPGAAASRRP